MVHPEVQIISAILQSRDLRSTKRAGLRPQHFGEPQCRAAYEYLLRFDEEHPGEVPDVEMFTRRSGFPDYVELEVSMSCASLAEEIVNSSHTRAIEQIIPSHAEMAQDPVAASTTLLMKLREAALAHAGVDVVAASDMNEKTRNEIGIDNKRIVGLPYPWEGLNEASMGMVPNELIAFYGRPGSYKSWSLLSVAVNVIETNPGANVLFYSPELDESAIRLMMASVVSKVPFGTVRKNKYSPDEGSQATMMLDLAISEAKSARGKLHFCFPRNLGISNLETLVDRLHPDLLLIDSAYMLEAIEDPEAMERKNIAAVTKVLRGIAKSKEIPIVAVFQANRKKDEHDGTHAGGEDLFGADAVSQNCDTMFRYYKYADDNGRTQVLIRVSKSRFFDIGGLVIEPPASGSCKQLEILHTEAAVDLLLSQTANRAKLVARVRSAGKSSDKLSLGGY